MGSGQSNRATHFQRSDTTAADQTVCDPLVEELPDDHHISISNKMVERLVEDATLSGGAAAASIKATPRGDYKDKIYIEKLKYMDDNHSERYGITAEDINALATRIELRTANMVCVEPVCAEYKDRVIECYNNTLEPAETVKCWDTVGAFTSCVQEAADRRLRARTQKDARAHARRERHVAHAREHALRDLGPAPLDDATAA